MIDSLTHTDQPYRWEGRFVVGGEVRWVATLWTADSVRFEPELGASNSFTWIRRSPDVWLARLETRGAPTPVVYEMSRLAE